MEHCNSYDFTRSQNMHLTSFDYILVLLKASWCIAIENLIASLLCKNYLVIESAGRFPDYWCIVSHSFKGWVELLQFLISDK